MEYSMSNTDTTETATTKTSAKNTGLMALAFFLGLSIGLIAGESDPIGYVKDKVFGEAVTLPEGELISDCKEAHNVWVILDGETEAFAGCSFSSDVKVEGKKSTRSCKEFVLPGSGSTTTEGETK
jgi:hypothetical protein